MLLKNKDEYEECLRKLMVPLRRRIESQLPCDDREVRALLADVLEYGEAAQDIRFLDCITYYEELGVKIEDNTKESQ